MRLKSLDHIVKIHQHWKILIGLAYLLFDPEIEILLSEFTTYESVRISISVPKQNQITKVNKPNLLNYIRKNCPMLESHWNGASYAQHSKKCSKRTSLLDLTKDYKKRTTNENLPIKCIKESTYKIWSIIYKI